MTISPEEKFMKNLEFYLDHKFDDYGRSRILGYLNEFKESIPPIYINKKVVKEVVVRRKQTEKEEGTCAYENMNQVANEICQLHNITIDQFFGKGGVKKAVMIEARRQFCEIMYNRYKYYNYILADFLGVHYSTISFYIFGKTYNINGKKNEYKRTKAAQ
jgi:hypothetical protein